MHVVKGLGTVELVIDRIIATGKCDAQSHQECNIHKIQGIVEDGLSHSTAEAYAYQKRSEDIAAGRLGHSYESQTARVASKIYKSEIARLMQLLAWINGVDTTENDKHFCRADYIIWVLKTLHKGTGDEWKRDIRIVTDGILSGSVHLDDGDIVKLLNGGEKDEENN